MFPAKIIRLKTYIIELIFNIKIHTHTHMCTISNVAAV